MATSYRQKYRTIFKREPPEGFDVKSLFCGIRKGIIVTSTKKQKLRKKRYGSV